MHVIKTGHEYLKANILKITEAMEVTSIVN